MPLRNAATEVMLPDPPSICHVQGALLNNAIHGAEARLQGTLAGPGEVTLKVRPCIGLLKLSGLPCGWRIRNAVLNTIT